MIFFERKQNNIMIPIYNNFKEMFVDLKAKYAKKIAVRTNGNQYNFEELYNLICIATERFIKSEITGKHIAIISEKSFEFVIVYFAAILANNVVIPIGNNYKLNEAEYIICDSDTNYIFYSDLCCELAEKLSKKFNIDNVRIENVQEIVNKNNNSLKINKCSIIESLKDNSDDLSMIVYTSGSEGKMNGVMLSQRNLMCSACGLAMNCTIKGNVILTLPLNHMYGWGANIFLVLIHGATICFISEMKELFSTLCKVEPECLFLVPSELLSFYRTIEGRLSRYKIDIEKYENLALQERREKLVNAYSFLGKNIKYIFTGGAPLAEYLYVFFKKIGIRVINLYGATECAPIICGGSTEYDTGYSVGINIPTCNIKLYNPDENGNGELIVNGKNVMLGYYNNTEKTKNTIIDGWYRTGDIARIDENGFVYIMGRVKNLIVLSNGENVSPEEIEKMLNVIDGVEESIVYAEENRIIADIYSPDENKHEFIKKSVAQINMNISDFKQIKKINFVEEPFQKTTIKKIIRKRKGIE